MSEPEPPRDPRMLHTRPGPRLLALAGLALVFIFYRPGTADPGLLQSVLLPLVALLSAFYLTGSVVAIAFGVMLIAGAHSDRDSAALAQPDAAGRTAEIPYRCLTLELQEQV